MKKSTQELLNEICTTDNILAMLQENTQEFLDQDADTYLQNKMREKGMKPADMARKSGRGDYVYKVLSGQRKASRDILLAIAFGLSLPVADTQMLLRLSGTAQLDPRKQRDMVILYALSKGHDVLWVNDLLYDMQQPIL